MPVRLAVVGDVDDRRIVTMVLGVEDSSVVEVPSQFTRGIVPMSSVCELLCLTGECCGSLHVRRPYSVVCLRQKCIFFVDQPWQS